MGRAPCCDKSSVKKGPWSLEEDAKLKTYIDHHGTGGNWIALPQRIGLKRCGKSCRLRWLNYLRPNLKHGGFSEEEDNIICSLYVNIGSRWSIMAAQLPGRTDNDIKNYWNTKLKKKLLGNQRKEQLQAQAHQVCSMNQEIKRESENWEVISQNPYWPREQSLANYNNVSNIQDYDLNNNQVSSLKSLLTKLGGVKFSYDLQQPYTNMMSSQSSSCDIPSTMNMINSGPITTYFPANTFQEFENLSNDLNNDLVGCVNSPEIDGSMMQFLCGIESMDVANGSSSMTSTDQSTGWEGINSLVYSPLVSNYQAC